MLAELATAFVSILAISLLVHLAVRFRSRNLQQSQDKTSAYFCGEKPVSGRFRVSNTYYQYLAYFMIFDSASLLVLLSTTGTASLDPRFLIIYLLAMMATIFVLLKGA